MQVQELSIPGVLLFRPTPHHDHRGLFTRTFDAMIAAEHGLAPEAFVQDSQSRSRYGTIRGLHGRSGRGEAKLVRVPRGAIFDVVVDARVGSPTFGEHVSVTLDDESFAHLYIPPGFLHGFQALSPHTDVCYRIDRVHCAEEDVSVRFDDPDLDIRWPLPVTAISDRDLAAHSWRWVADQALTERDLLSAIGSPATPVRVPAQVGSGFAGSGATAAEPG